MLGKLHVTDLRHYIPRLVYITDTQTTARKMTKPVPGPNQPGAGWDHLYRLDWDAVDEYKRDIYTKWSTEIKRPPSDTPATLPVEMDAIVKKLTFAIKPSYMAEINHMSSVFFLERQRQRNFDTVIRDMCANVGTAAINCAFKLLSDCVHDGQFWQHELESVYGTIDRHMLQAMMRYKFWNGLTGRGLVYDHAGFYDIARCITYKSGKKIGQTKEEQRSETANRLVATIISYQDDLEDYYKLPADLAPPQVEEVHCEQVADDMVVSSDRRSITGKLSSAPVKKTVCVRVYKSVGFSLKEILAATFGDDGMLSTVLVDDFQLEIDDEASVVTEDLVIVKLASGPLPGGVCATVTYEPVPTAEELTAIAKKHLGPTASYQPRTKISKGNQRT